MLSAVFAFCSFDSCLLSRCFGYYSVLSLQLLLSFLGKHLACLLIPNIPLTALSLGFSPLLLRLAGDYSILKHNAPLSEEVLSQFSVCSSKLMVPSQELHQEKLSMCGVPEESNTKPRPSNEDSSSGMAGKERPLDGDPDDNSFWLLELAANNDLDKFRQGVEEGKANVDAVGSWYSRHNGTSKMVLEQRTPAMIAALYGSLDVLRYIVNSYGTSGGDVDRTCGSDGITALHCAAAGGSVCAVETVTLLLDFGANLNALDAQGRRPADVIRVSPRAAHTRAELEELLKGMKLTQVMPDHVPADPESGVSSLDGSVEDGCLPATFDCASLFYDVHMGEAAADGGVVEPSTIPSSPSVTAVLLGASGLSPSPTSSPKSLDTGASKVFGEGGEKTREYLVDPSVPDIKNSIYMTDEFRMFSFKIRPCSRAYSHDWTECPFVHPGENARRRDPRRYHYSCVPCPDFRKGACRRGDACEYAHGVFESWLHPAQYRTRLCKDGTGCTRRVCFFAHTTEELRPLYVSTGSAVPSLRTTASLDMMSMSPPLTPGSPSSFSAMSPFSLSNSAQDHTQGGVATPPMSPSSSSANSLGWPQPNLPALKLPGVGLHGSRLRAALNARDISLDGLTRPSDFDGQLMSEFASLSSQALSTQARMNAAVVASACGTTSSRAGKYRSLGLSVAPTNLEELFASELVSSPRSVVHDAALLSQMEAQMHSQKSARLQSQLHSQLQAQLSSQVFPQVSAQMQLQLQQAALDSQLQGSPLSQSPVQSPAFSLGSLGHMATLRGMDVDRQGISGTPLSPAGVAARLAFAQRDKRSHSSRDLGAALATDWGSPTGKPEWGVQGDDLSKFRKSASFGVRESEEPDLTWVQRLVKEGPLEADAASTTTPCSGNGAGSGQREGADDASVLGSWIDKMHLDQIVA